MESSTVQPEWSVASDDQNDEVAKKESFTVLEEVLLASTEQKNDRVEQVKSEDSSVLADGGGLQNGCSLETSTGMEQEMGPFTVQQEVLLTSDGKNDKVEQARSEADTLMPDERSLQNYCIPESEIGIKPEIEPSTAQHEVFLFCDNQNNKVKQFGNEVEPSVPNGDLQDDSTPEGKTGMEHQVESSGVQHEVLLQTADHNDIDELVGSADNTVIPDEGSWPNDYTLESWTGINNNPSSPIVTKAASRSDDNIGLL